jgi:F0F1-type ATP synthase assembly protein I
MINLHTTLYGLLLGIFDDLFANTQIHILSDEISLDIVPKSTFSDHGDNDTQHQKGGKGNRTKTGSKGEDNSKSNHEKSDGTKERTNESKRMDRMTMSVAYVSTVTFMTGLGLGFALSSSINDRR